MNTAEQLYDYDEELENQGPWKFSEAPEEAKQAAIEKNSDINTDHDWWDCTKDGFAEQMKEKGIRVDESYFSGFWSQGDGACFEGAIDDTDKFFSSHFKDSDFPCLRMLFKLDGGLNFSCRHTGHYYHEHSVSFDFDVEDWEQCHNYDEEDIRYKMLQILMEDFENECSKFEEAATEIFRDYMKGYYRTLEADYDYLTSDEAISEHLQDYEIDEDGNIV